MVKIVLRLLISTVCLAICSKQEKSMVTIKPGCIVPNPPNIQGLPKH